MIRIKIMTDQYADYISFSDDLLENEDDFRLMISSNILASIKKMKEKEREKKK